MIRPVKTLLFAIVAVVSLGVERATANPDVWVGVGITFQFEEHKVTGMTFVWRFDDYYSSRAIQTYDRDRDGDLGPEEVANLRTESFDPLARFDYYVHIWVHGEKRSNVEVEDFAASIEATRLIFQFTVPVVPPADPSEGPVIASLFDKATVVDFRFFESDFLLVKGAMRADCKFRVARGTGAQSDHPQPVTLTCGT